MLASHCGWRWPSPWEAHRYVTEWKGPCPDLSPWPAAPTLQLRSEGGPEHLAGPWGLEAGVNHGWCLWAVFFSGWESQQAA